jgi:hypothetical protein
VIGTGMTWSYNPRYVMMGRPRYGLDIEGSLDDGENVLQSLVPHCLKRILTKSNTPLSLTNVN